MTIERIGGYFAVWNEEPQEDRGYGAIAPNAMHLSTVRNITMLYGTHDGRVYAQTKRRTLRFFNDAYGCAFTADVNLDHPGSVALVNAIGSGEVWGASWGAESFADLATNADGRVQFCRFDHFALTSSPNYLGTGVWRMSQPLNTLQPWLRDLRRTFNDTLIARARREQSPTQEPSNSCARAVSVGALPAPRANLHRGKATVPASVAAVLAAPNFAWAMNNAATARAQLAQRDRSPTSARVFIGSVGRLAARART